MQFTAINQHKNNRNSYVDFIRSVAIIIIMITHVLSFHRSNKLVYFIWNYLHFVVAALVFCSGYVLYFKYKDYFKTLSIILSWYGKRLSRLILPFYYYLLLHYSLWYLFPDLFDGWGLKKNLDFVIRSVTFTGGVDFNWFTLLFTQLTILFPIIILSFRKKILLVFLVLLSILSTLYFALIGYQGGNYRYIMWLPWMSILFLSIFFRLKDKNEVKESNNVKRYLVTGSIFFGMFIVFHKFFASANKNLELTEHKYPPDIIYLTYGVALTCLLFALSRANFLYKPALQKIYHFIGRRTYQLFFIHYIVLDFILKTTQNLEFYSKPIVQVILVISISLLITLIIRYIGKFFSPPSRKSTLA